MLALTSIYRQVFLSPFLTLPYLYLLAGNP